MPSAALLAHADPHGLVAPHVLRHARSLADVSDRVVVISSSPLRPEVASAVEEVAELVLEPAATSVWGAWSRGLEVVDAWSGLDRLLLADGAAVGPFRPLAEVVGEPSPTLLRGVCATGPHLQRQLLDVGGRVLASTAVRAFWTGVAGAGPRPDPHLLERNLSRTAAAAGFGVVPLFVPGPSDRTRARALALRRSLGQVVTTTGERRASALRALRRPPVQLLDPMVACWYRAVDGSLPYLDASVLLHDPARVGRGRMLDALEGAHPGAMAGVRDYLARLASDALVPRKKVAHP